MDPHKLTNEQEDEIKLLLLSDDEEEQVRGKNLLFAAHKEDILHCIDSAISQSFWPAGTCREVL